MRPTPSKWPIARGAKPILVVNDDDSRFPDSRFSRTQRINGASAALAALESLPDIYQAMVVVEEVQLATQALGASSEDSNSFLEIHLRDC